jgi:hypothetical protein
MDVAAWLRDLGLERYVPAFRDNDIDAEVLPKLTAEDLQGLAVPNRARAQRQRLVPISRWLSLTPGA